MTAHQRMPQPSHPVWLRARPVALVVIATVTLAAAFVTMGCGGGEATSSSPSDERVTGTGATRDSGDADQLSGSGNGLTGDSVIGSGATARKPQPPVRAGDRPDERSANDQTRPGSEDGAASAGDEPPDENAISELPPGSTVPERLTPPRPAPQRPALERLPEAVGGANDRTEPEPAQERPGP